MEKISLKFGEQELVVAPEIGGSILSWRYKDKDILRGVANPDLKAQQNTPVGCYPLIPYSNRINKGHFSFEGKDYSLTPNMGTCPHAIHGNAWELPWKLQHKTDDSMILIVDSDPKTKEGANWPFKYRATLSFRLYRNSLIARVVVENRDTVNQPVGFGLHPFFAVSDKATVTLDAPKVWTNNKDGLPDQLVETTKEWNFSEARDVSALVIDNCFSEYKGHCTIKDEGEGRIIKIKSSPIFEHVLMFHPKGADFLAVEPVTNLTDAINTLEPYAGLHILKPGQIVGGDMHFEVEEL